MKKTVLKYIIILGTLLSSLSYLYWREVKDFIISSSLSEIYVSFFKKEKAYDQDHVITHLENGMKIIVNIHDRCVCRMIRILGRWDRNETRVLEKLIQPGFKVVEVGANFGCYTLLMSKLVGENGSVIAFEANPYVSKYLKKSVELNNLTNVIIYENAVAQTSYKGFMVYGLSNIGGGYILPDTQNSQETCKTEKCVPIKVITLDEVLGSVSINVLKMDAEGSEAWILDGATKTIENSKDIIIVMEWVTDHLKRNSINIEAFVQKLKSYGFNFWRINKKEGIESISADELVKAPPLDIIMSRQDVTRYFK